VKEKLENPESPTGNTKLLNLSIISDKDEK
jgi:hypothetical protein